MIHRVFSHREREFRVLIGSRAWLFALLHFIYLVFPILFGKRIYDILYKLWGKKTALLRFDKFMLHVPFSTLLNTFGHVLYDSDFQEGFKPRYGNVVFDVGANIGAFAAVSSVLVGESGFVVAVEPEPSNFALLRKNLSINSFKNVMALQLALSNEDGSSVLYVHPYSSGWHSTERGTEASYARKLLVSTRTLDTLVKELNLTNKLNLVKIDTQGAELKILQGAISSLRDGKVEKMIIEIHRSRNAIVSLLKSLKFNVVSSNISQERLFVSITE